MLPIMIWTQFVHICYNPFKIKILELLSQIEIRLWSIRAKIFYDEFDVVEIRVLVKVIGGGNV
jgi:hypothetical protein